MDDPLLRYREQHKLRLSYMPWLYWKLKPQQRDWAKRWQDEWQSYLQEMETVVIEGDCFISPEAKLFAEPGRPIHIAEGSFIAADTVMHGPIQIGKKVSINHHVTMDGGKRGIRIGDHSRIAAYCSLYAFNHLTEKSRPIGDQKVRSEGIVLGDDVWLGAHVAVLDGVSIRNGAVAGTRSVVTHDVPEYTVVGGNPAKKIKERS